MLDDWYRVIRLPVTIEQFHRLPRNSAYKYEYWNNEARLSPRPKTLNAVLSLSRREAVSQTRGDLDVLIRPLRSADWANLPNVFAASFHRMQPFASLADADQLRCAHECVEQTRSGGDGPVVDDACFVAESEGEIIGAILISLIPIRAEGEWWNGKWDEPPPPDAVERKLGRPHLTWVFVSPLHAARGVGSVLLSQSVHALLDLGFSDLASTFLVGNDASVLWHWRNGFRLLPYAGSMRYVQDRWLQLDADHSKPAGSSE